MAASDLSNRRVRPSTVASIQKTLPCPSVPAAEKNAGRFFEEKKFFPFASSAEPNSKGHRASRGLHSIERVALVDPVQKTPGRYTLKDSFSTIKRPRASRDEASLSGNARDCRISQRSSFRR